MMIKKIIIIFCIIFISFTFCNAEEEVTLQWDPSIDAPYIVGYRVYQTEIEGEYILHSDVFDNWVPNTDYTIGDKITELGVHYICNTDHTSSICEAWVPGTDYIVGSKVYMYGIDYVCNADHVGSICDAWAPNTSYVIDDRVSNSDANYICKIDHVSSIFDAWVPCIDYVVGDNIQVLDVNYKCNINHASSSCSVWASYTDYIVGSRVSESGNYYTCNTDHTSSTSFWTNSSYDPELFASWTDYRLTLTIRSDDDDAIGVMFRYQDNDNYYRFSWDRQRSYRRLVKQENGEFVVLAEDTVMYVSGETYELEVVADGNVLQIWIDGSPIFTVEDGSFSAGSIAFYSWGNCGSHFDDVHVKKLVTEEVLFSEDFNNGEFSNWNVVDEGNIDGPSAWSAESGMLVQSSNIYSDPTELAKFGTFALYILSDDTLNWDLYTPIFSEDVVYWDIHTSVFMDELSNWTYFPLFMDDINNWTEISLMQDDIANWDVLSNNMVWTGPGLTCTLPVIYPITYYVATCYDTRGLESAKSNEVFRGAQPAQSLNISLTDMSEDNFNQCVDRRVVDDPFTVCWDACENAINYELKIAHYFYAGLETDVVITSEICYTFNNLPKSSRHFEIKVRAVYSEGYGDWNSTASDGSPKNWLIYSKPGGAGW